MIRANRCRWTAMNVPWMKQPGAPRTATLIAGRRQLASPYAARPAASFKEWNRRTCEVIIVQQTALLKRPPRSSVNACRTAGVKLGLVCFVLVASKCLYEYWHEFKPIRLHRYVWQKVIILSVIRLLRLWIEELNTCMITYTAGEVLVLQPTDVTRTRTVRKSIVGFRLWHPRPNANNGRSVTREFRHMTCFPRTDTADHGQSREHTRRSTVGSRNALSEIVFGCLNIRSLLNKYDDVVDLCGDGQR